MPPRWWRACPLTASGVGAGSHTTIIGITMISAVLPAMPPSTSGWNSDDSVGIPGGARGQAGQPQPPHPSRPSTQTTSKNGVVKPPPASPSRRQRRTVVLSTSSGWWCAARRAELKGRECPWWPAVEGEFMPQSFRQHLAELFFRSRVGAELGAAGGLWLQLGVGFEAFAAPMRTVRK